MIERGVDARSHLDMPSRFVEIAKFSPERRQAVLFVLDAMILKSRLEGDPSSLPEDKITLQAPLA